MWTDKDRMDFFERALKMGGFACEKKVSDRGAHGVPSICLYSALCQHVYGESLRDTVDLAMEKIHFREIRDK